HRRLVDGDLPARADGAVRGRRGGPAIAARPAAGPVCRLRGLAALLADGGGPGDPALLLARAPGRVPGPSRAAGGPVTPGGTDPAGGRPAAGAAPLAHPAARGTGPARGGDAVHGAAGGVCGPPRPLLRPTGRGGGLA